MASPEKNIYWRNIPADARIEERGQPGTRFFVAMLPGGEAVAYWGTRDAHEAQKALAKRAAR